MKVHCPKCFGRTRAWEVKRKGLSICASRRDPCPKCGGFEVRDELAGVCDALKALKDKIEELLTYLEARSGR